MISIIRQLEIGMHGEDVRSLHDDLILLRYSFPIAERVESLFGEETQAAVVDFKVRNGLGDHGVVDERTAGAITATANEIRPRVVKGHVSDGNGRPPAGLIVSAVDRDLRSETELGRCTVAVDGSYEISYTPEQFQRAEKGEADLILRIVGDTDGQVLVSSPIVFNAQSAETVNLVVPGSDGGSSELERYADQIAPVLDGATLLELGEEDIDFLAGETGIAREHLIALVGAARREAADGADASMPNHPDDNRIPAAAFYAWLRQGIEYAPAHMYAHPIDELMALLRTAIDERMIPESLRPRLDRIGVAVRLRQSDQALRPAPDGAAATLGDLLETMPDPLDRTQRRLVARVIAELSHSDEGFEARLRDAGVHPPRIGAVKTTLRLGDLALGHAPMVRLLQNVAGPDDAEGLRPLAALRADQWLDLAYTSGRPAHAETDGRSLDEAEYAKALQGQVEVLHPTEALSGRLKDGSLALNLHTADHVLSFLQSHPDFDIVDTSIPTYVAKLPQDSVPERERVTMALQTLQRTKALGATWRESAVLANAGFANALTIVRRNPGQLRESVGHRIEPARLEEIHLQATRVHDTTLASMALALPRFTGTGVAAMPKLVVDATPLADHPTLQNLFGSLDTCACRHCRSVLSPAAYLVDLLQFIRDTPAYPTLLSRRPDLVDLDLSCENTERELPCIDLSLEILENAATLPLKVIFSPGTNIASELPAAVLSAPIRQALERTTDQLSPVLRAEQDPLPAAPGTTEWTVTDDRRRWTLRHRHEALTLAVKGDAPEMRPMPVNPAESVAMVADFDAGKVPVGIRTALEAQYIPRDGLLHPRDLSVTPLEPGARWNLAYRFAVRVHLEWHEPFPGLIQGNGTMELWSMDGVQLFGESYSGHAVARTAEELERGVVGTILREVLRHRGTFTVESEPDKWWRIEQAGLETELAYITDELTVTALTYQSSGRTEDLGAFPENRNPAAYERLRVAEFPWSLPFDLPLVETRALLERAGTTRLQLVEQLDPAQRFTNGTAALEVLGLSQSQAELLLRSAAGDRLWEIWGLQVIDGSASVRDAKSGERVTGAPLAVLSRVSILLQQAGLSHAELLDVLQSRFVRGGGPALVVTPLDECQPSRMVLDGLTEPVLDRMHRFVRLWRQLGWRMHELDIAISSFMSPALLERLSHLQRLQQLLGLPIDELTSWWDGFRAPVYRAHTITDEPEITPLYERLFARLGVRNPPDLAFRLNPARTELAGTGLKIRAKADALAAAFGVREADISRLLDTLFAPDENDDLSLENISRTHRAVSLAKALRLSIDAYLQIQQITGIDAFQSTDSAILFCEAAHFVRGSGFTNADLDYLLRHQYRAGSPVALSDATAAQILGEVRAALVSVQSEFLAPGIASATALRTCLTRLECDSELIENVISALHDGAEVMLPDDGRLLRSISIPAPLRHLVAIAGRRLATLNLLPASAFDPDHPDSLYAAVEAAHPSHTSWVEAVDDLKAATSDTRITESLEATGLFGKLEIDAMVAVKADVDSRARVVLRRAVCCIQRQVAVLPLAGAFGVGPDTMTHLLVERLSAVNDSTKPAIDVLLDPALIDSDPSVPPSSAACTEAYAMMRRLHKSALLISKLSMEGVPLRWLGGGWVASAGLSVIDFNTLPTETESGAADLYQGWRQLVVLCQLRDRAAGAEAMITRYVGALTEPTSTATQHVAEACQALADALDVPATTVASAAKRLKLDEEALRDPISLTRLLTLVQTLSRLGTDVGSAGSLARPAPDFNDARTARSLLRSRYGAGDWIGALKPVTDHLRRQQRDALVAHLVATDQLVSSEDLYEQYLIDVLMGPCLTTTRLLQATSAVQLFVHRCLLHVEPGVPPTAIDRSRWEWMKNYRVWEANRKVFLFAENWLMPELRDDKSEPFRRLESGLSQGEPSRETARDALLTYVDDLAELAQITVLGMYEHVPPTQPGGPARQDPAVLYVVGRSPNQPYRYFWRKCERFAAPGMQWTPWEHVEMDISGTHVMPFVFEGDFHIAWPVIRKATSAAGNEQWEVQLAWARHTSNRWTQKKISRDTFLAKVLPGKDERATFTFRIEKDPQAALGATASGNTSGAERIRFHCYVARDPQDLKPIKTSVVPQVNQSNFLNINPRVLVNVTPGDPNPRYEWAVDPTVVLIESRTAASVTKIETFPIITPSYNHLPAPPDAKYALSITYQGETQTTPEVSTSTTHLALYWRPEIIFNGGKDSPTLPVSADPERPLEMTGIGQFELVSGQDIRWLASNTPNLEIAPNASVHDNGFRERQAQPSDYFELHIPNADWLAFGKTPGRFFALPAAPHKAKILHYEDEAGKYFLRGSPNEIFVVSDGHLHAGRFPTAAKTSVKRLFSPEIQALTDHGTAFAATNVPSPPPGPSSCTEQGVSFDLRTAYASYNWELFLHAPLLIADQLAKQQRFAEARQWLHLVFDPTTDETGSDPSRFWRCVPLRAAAQGKSVRRLIDWLANPHVHNTDKEAFRNQVETWQKNPFRPHAVARLRHSTYQWRALFSYLDILMDGGDHLFRHDTREALDEAALHYVLAAKLLGPRPQSIAPRRKAPTLSYRSVAGRWDEFSNTWLSLSDQPVMKGHSRLVGPHMADQADQSSLQLQPGAIGNGSAVLTSLGVSYFGVPKNDKLTEYWNRVEDRLFKIRHCQNIDGIARDLPLFEPQIDPALLVRAAAEGVDLADVLAGRSAPLPHYRFGTLVQKTNELCVELQSLGSALLSALEKRDAEQLSHLRSAHEVEMLLLLTEIKQENIDEATRSVEALSRSRGVVEARFAYYQRLMGAGEVLAPREGESATEVASTLKAAPSGNLGSDIQGYGLVQSEVDQLYRLSEAQGFNLAGGVANAVSGSLFTLAAINDAYKKWAEPLGQAFKAGAGTFEAIAAFSGSWATRDALLAGYQRRREDWSFQSNAALRELAQIDKQKAAADIRVAIARLDAENHKKQIENTRAVDVYMHEKYTNDQLYSWMVGQISSVFFSTHQLALDTARRAQRALAFELGLPESGVQYLRPRYWDSLKKGLIAGDHLRHDLKRMELAYLELNKREYELTTHVSMRQHDPLALIQLKETGRCEISLPETLFDLDCPAYLRRIRSVGLSVAGVTGPYTSVSCRLTLLSSNVRQSTALRNGKYERADEGANLDDRFKVDHGLVQAMVTSTGTNDTGLFETNLRDERYLWFEGAGAISTWRLELPAEFRQFDYESISDVVLHMRYTAREGGDQFRSAAVAALERAFDETTSQPLTRLLSLRQEYPSEWARFTAKPAGTRTQAFSIKQENFPYLFRDSTLVISRVDALGVPNEESAALPDITSPPTQANADPAGPLDLVDSETIGGLLHKATTQDQATITVDAADPTWTLTGGVEVTKLRDLMLIVTYTANRDTTTL